jgi:hypothetical protein
VSDVLEKSEMSANAESVIGRVHRVSKEEFDESANRHLERGNNTFNSTPVKGSDLKVDFAYRGGDVELGFVVSDEIFSQLTEEQRERLGISTQGGMVEFVDKRKKGLFERSNVEESDQERETGEGWGPPDNYFINGEKPRVIRAEADSVKKVTVDDVAKLIEETPGDGIVFYTGAGISRGGESPIWGMNEFLKEMHMDSGELEFVTNFASNAGDLAKRFRDFIGTFYEDVSTPAHIAIKNIVEQKPGASVFTENHDLKHEAEGSRIKPVHLGNQRSYNQFIEAAERAELLITVGLSHDDRAGIELMKKENPNLKIVAFSLPIDQATLPNFLAENDPNDSAILEDAQVLLPEVAEKVKETT